MGFEKLKKLVSIIGIVLFAVASANVVNAQCPMCKTALKSNRDGKAAKSTVGNGINKGILFLLATPYVLLGTAGVFLYKAKRQKKNNA